MNVRLFVSGRMRRTATGVTPAGTVYGNLFLAGFIRSKGGESCIISVLAEEVDLPDGLPAGATRQPPNMGQSVT